jgi:hypothetical protein
VLRTNASKMSTARDTLFMASLLRGAASVVIIRLTTNAMVRTAATIKVVIITLTFLCFS